MSATHASGHPTTPTISSLPGLPPAPPDHDSLELEDGPVTLEAAEYRALRASGRFWRNVAIASLIFNGLFCAGMFMYSLAYQRTREHGIAMQQQGMPDWARIVDRDGKRYKACPVEDPKLPRLAEYQVPEQGLTITALRQKFYNGCGSTTLAAFKGQLVAANPTNADGFIQITAADADRIGPGKIHLPPNGCLLLPEQGPSPAAH